jgi:type I restriction enzyme M protein
LVSQASNALIKDNEHFASLWDYAETDRRRFILMLCHKEATGPDPLQLGVIQEHMLAYGIEADDETLIADLEFLRELELIELIGKATGGHYTLAIPLMGIWIEKQQDFAAVLSKARLETEDRHE